MADDRKEEAKAPHWTSSQISEASSHPHTPEIKEQSSSGDGLVRSANGFPYREEEDGGYGARGEQSAYSRTKENGINGEFATGEKETAGKGPRAQPLYLSPFKSSLLTGVYRRHFFHKDSVYLSNRGT